jgi:hypothetical protein
LNLPAEATEAWLYLPIVDMLRTQHRVAHVCMFLDAREEDERHQLDRIAHDQFARKVVGALLSVRSPAHTE